MSRDKIPTMKDVAAVAGVSLGTVSKVLNGHPTVAAQLRRKVLDAASQLHYAHNMVAAGLRRRATRTIGIIVPDLRNTFFAEVIEVIEAAASNAGVSVLIMTTGENPVRTEERIRALVERRVDGIVIIPSLQMRVDPALSLRLTLPTVLVDRVEPTYWSSSVATDSENAVYLGTKHLLSIDHQAILFAVNSLVANNSRDRVHGFERAIAEAGVSASKVIVAGISVEEVRNSLREALAERAYTALFTASNPVTIGAMKAIADLSLHIPDDLSLLAFDDFEWLSLVPPFISAIRQPADAIGREVWRLLEEQIESRETVKRHAYLPAEIVLRQSTVSPKKLRKRTN